MVCNMEPTEEYPGLTREELIALDEELQVCYLFIPWNKSKRYRNVKEWAEDIGWVHAFRTHRFMGRQACIDHAIKEVASYQDFINAIMLGRKSTEDKVEDVQDDLCS